MDIGSMRCQVAFKIFIYNELAPAVGIEPTTN